MTLLRGLPVLALFCALSVTAPARGEEAKADRGDRAEKSEPFQAERAVTHHQADVTATPFTYTATAEFLPLREGTKEEVAARVFTVSYVQDGQEAGRRPVAFVFNGGPGAASAYLHLGALGPKVLAFNADGSLPRPPVPLVDNPDTWLAFTDLVFVDPVGTGYSRPLKAEEEVEKRFWKVDADARAMAEIVRLWLDRAGRWTSPKFLVGESYGGLRVAKMASELFNGPGIAVNGVVMVSPVVDFGTISDDDTGLLASAFKLPAMAAAAVHFGRAEGAPGAAAPEVAAAEAAERFALDTYLSGLATLDTARLDASADVFGRVAKLTGMAPVEVVRRRGRIPAGVFARELLRDQGLILSVYDATFTGPDPDPGASDIHQDPFLTGTRPAFATAFAGYVQGTLGFHTDAPFHLLSGRVNQGWEWPRGARPSALSELQAALTLTPGLRVLIAHGRTDLVTPSLGSVWLARRIELPGDERDRLEVRVYDGGHMMYSRGQSRHLLSQDVKRLMDEARRR